MGFCIYISTGLLISLGDSRRGYSAHNSLELRGADGLCIAMLASEGEEQISNFEYVRDQPSSQQSKPRGVKRF